MLRLSPCCHIHPCKKKKTKKKKLFTCNMTCIIHDSQQICKNVPLIMATVTSQYHYTVAVITAIIITVLFKLSVIMLHI